MTSELPAQSRDLPFECRRCHEKFLGSLALALHFAGGWGAMCVTNPADVGLDLIAVGDQFVWAAPSDTRLVGP